jgi:tetratricopeptide (TPR) repeat protein
MSDQKDIQARVERARRGERVAFDELAATYQASLRSPIEQWAQLRIGIQRYQRQRNTLDGLEKLLKAAGLKPDSYLIHLHVGFAFESLGLNADALEHYLQAAELVQRERLEEKAYLSSLMQAGNALARRSQIQEAREQGLAILRKAADDPRFFSVSMVLADLAGALVDNEQYEEAFDVVERALRVDRNHPLPLVTRGVAHGKLGRPREALGGFLSALQADRDQYFSYVAERMIRLFYEHRDADFGDPLVQLKRGVEGEFARGRADATALWNLWIMVSVWLERMRIEDVLQRVDALLSILLKPVRSGAQI